MNWLLLADFSCCRRAVARVLDRESKHILLIEHIENKKTIKNKIKAVWD